MQEREKDMKLGQQRKLNIYWDNKQISLKTRGTKSSLCEERLVGSVTASPLLLPLTLAEQMGLFVVSARTKGKQSDLIPLCVYWKTVRRA